MYFWSEEVIYPVMLWYTSILLHGFNTSSSCRPHDRVTLKDMKTDWHACLENKIGFKILFAFSIFLC